MAAKAQKKRSDGGYVSGKSLLATPPGILGFSSLLEPDQYQEGDAPKFKARWHFSPAALERLEDLVNEHAFSDDMLEALKERLEGKLPAVVDLRQYLESKAKTPREEDRIQEPYIQFERKAFFINKKGEEQRANLKVWDVENHLLDLPSLRIGMGSTVQVIVTPGLFVTASPLLPDFAKKKVCPSFRLEGLRVIKLEQYGKGGPKLGELTEADKALLEEGIEPDVLSQYVRRPDKPTADHDKVLSADEIPF